MLPVAKSLLQQGTVWSYHMDFVLPCKQYGIIATPLDIFWYGLCFWFVFPNLVLEVAGNYPDLAVFCIESHVESVRRHTDILEGSIGKDSVFSFARVDHVDSLTNSQQNFHGARKGMSGRYHGPRMHSVIRRDGKKLRPWFDIVGHSN